MGGLADFSKKLAAYRERRHHGSKPKPRGRRSRSHNLKTCVCISCLARRKRVWNRLALPTFEEWAREQDSRFPFPLLTMFQLAGFANPGTGRSGRVQPHRGSQ